MRLIYETVRVLYRRPDQPSPKKSGSHFIAKEIQDGIKGCSCLRRFGELADCPTHLIRHLGRLIGVGSPVPDKTAVPHILRGAAAKPELRYYVCDRKTLIQMPADVTLLNERVDAAKSSPDRRNGRQFQVDAKVFKEKILTQLEILAARAGHGEYRTTAHERLFLAPNLG